MASKMPKSSSLDASESTPKRRPNAAGGASSSRGAPRPSPTFALDLNDRQLLIGGHVAKFDTFSDDPFEPWFDAEAIHSALGCSAFTRSLGRLHPDDVMSFGDLIRAKGLPLGGVALNATPIGYDEANAIRRSLFARH